MVVSRRTIIALGLTLLVAIGIRLWTMGQWDPCAKYLAGDRRAPASQLVVSGTRQIVVPCRDWLPRQQEPVQIACLADLAAALAFVLYAAGDVIVMFQVWRERRRATARIG